MNKIIVKGSWGNTLFTGFDMSIGKKNIAINYGDSKNHVHLTYPYSHGTSQLDFRKFIDAKHRDDYDFVIDGTNLYLYDEKTYLYNLALHMDLIDEFFKTLDKCLGFDFYDVAKNKWEKIIKDGFNQKLYHRLY